MKKFIIFGKQFLFATMLCTGLCLSVSCGDDDDEDGNPSSSYNADDVSEQLLKQLKEAETVFANSENQTVNLTFSVSADELSVVSKFIGSYKDVDVNLTLEANEDLKIDKYVFSKLENLVGITIPEGVTSIGEGAFADCSALTNVNLSNTITQIAWFAFSNCSSLSNISFPESVTSIGNSSFSNCTSLKNIIIPETLKEPAVSAFKECTSLESIKFLGKPSFLNNIPTDCVIYMKSEYYDSYKKLFPNNTIKTF